MPAEQERFVRSPLIVTGLPRLEKTREKTVELLGREIRCVCFFEGFCMQSVPIKVIRQPGLEQLTGLSKSTLSDLQNPKSPRFDVTFPSKVRLTGKAGKPGKAVGWFSNEVIEWLESRKVVSQARGTK